MNKKKLVLLHSNDMHGDFLAEKKEGFEEYKKQTRMLLPIKKFAK